MSTKEKKISPAKRRIIMNYEEQKERLLAGGYEERTEVISVVKANVMAFVTAGPFIILAVLIWVLSGVGKDAQYNFKSAAQPFLFLLLFFITVFIHELLHGAGWSVWTKGKWKSIYLGVMWEYLTPYCHCKEPLKPKQYLVGVLTPFVILGAGMFAIALAAGSHMLLLLSLINMLSAGGDTTIACMELKYLKQNDSCYILDHPTDCGFIAFVKV